MKINIFHYIYIYYILFYKKGKNTCRLHALVMYSMWSELESREEFWIKCMTWHKIGKVRFTASGNGCDKG